MRRQRLAVLLVAGLFIGPVLADRKKASPCEVTPPAIAAAPAPADKPCPAGLTLPSPQYLNNAEQYCPDPTTRMQQLLNESEDLKQAREEFHRFWMNNQPSTLTYERYSERPIVKTYAVADLVVPIPPAGSPPPAEKPKTLEYELIRKITANVEPRSWSAAGGPGTIEYFPLGLALVVNQAPVVHEAVERYLDALRKINDLQVTTELVVVTLSDDWFQKAGLHKAFAGCEGECKGRTRGVCVKPEAVQKLLRAAKEAGGIEVFAAPKITTLCGQAGSIKVCETEQFVTGVTVDTVDGNVAFTPKKESHDLGLSLSVTPELSADGRFVKLVVAGGLKELGVRPVRLIPISTRVQPVSSDTKPADAVPFTQFIQEPKILNRKVAGTVSVADGGTAILYGGKTTIQETTKQSLPFAVDVPVLQALFTRDKTEATTNHLLVVVTAHVVKPEGCCSDCDACPKCDTKLAKLLGDYSQACKAGKVEDARRLAIECLAIDPTCFGKK
jgi:Bacterial type II and III secretion system protein